MNDILVCLQAMTPLFIPMLLGFLLACRGVISKDFGKAVNGVVFRCFLPLSVFCSVYTGHLSLVGQLLPLAGYVCLALLVAFSLCMLLIPRLIRQPERATVVIQSCWRGNAVILGIPLLTVFCGETNIAVPSLLILVSVMVFNILAVLDFELLLSRGVSGKKLLLSIIKNPLLLAMAAGIAAALLKIELPDAIYSSLKGLGNLASPLCFVAIGASFDLSIMRKNSALLWLITAVKLVVLPLVCLLPAVFFLQCRGALLVAMTTIFASPCAAGSYSMALQYHADGDLASESIMVTSVLSLLTLFLWLVLFGTMGLL